MTLSYTQTAVKASRIFNSFGIDFLNTVESGVRKEKDHQATISNMQLSPEQALESRELNEKLSIYDNQFLYFLDSVSNDIQQKLVITFGASVEHIIINTESKTEEDTRYYESIHAVFFDNRFPRHCTMPFDSHTFSHLNDFVQECLDEGKDKASKEIDEFIGSVVFINGTSGHFVHEILGHLLEADIFLNEQMIMRKSGISFDVQIAPKEINLVDTPFDCKSQTNLNRIDDEGVTMHEIPLISEGRITGCLCTNENAMAIARPDLAGCARRQSFKYPTLPRMRNTQLLPNTQGLACDELIQSAPCVVLQKVINGTVNPFTGDFMINGSGWTSGLNHPMHLPNITINGNLLQCLASPMQLGNDFQQQHTQCRKEGQFIPIVVGGPTMRLNNLRIRAKARVADNSK